MANKNMPNGFQPKGEPLRCNSYVAGGTVYPGDVVKQDSAGKVVAGTAGAAACGVARSYATVDQALDVYDHPNQEFVAQAAASEIDAQTDINQNASIVATAGDATYKQSRMQIDGSTLASTATLELKILALEPSVGNAFGANARVICKINNHQLSSGTGTAGV